MPASNRDLEKGKHWQQIIAEYQQSGMNGSQFCKSRSLKPSRCLASSLFAARKK